MPADHELTALETLGLAIKSEVVAVQVYEKMKRKVRNKALKEKLGFLAGEEKKHRRILAHMYKKMFPETSLLLPDASLVPGLAAALGDDRPVPRLFETAMEAERSSEDFYRAQAARAEDPSGKTTFQYLANMELSHYYLLKSEYDLIMQDEAYYKVEQYEMVHFGP